MDKMKAFKLLFTYKLCSTFAQLYMGSLIASNASAEFPIIALDKIAHMGAVIVALRGIDALIDPAFNALKPAELKAIANETTSSTTVK